jgi:hypothetical protein
MLTCRFREKRQMTQFIFKKYHRGCAQLCKGYQPETEDVVQFAFLYHRNTCDSGMARDRSRIRDFYALLR